MKRFMLLMCCLAMVFSLACSSPEKTRDSFIKKSEKQMALGEYEKALIELKNALKVDEKSPRVHMLFGQIKLRKGDFRGAFGSFNKAVELDPELLEARAYLGQLYLAGGEMDKAEEQETFIRSKDQGHARGMVLRASILGRKGERNEAKKILTEVTAKAPQTEDAYMVLSILAREDKDLEESSRVLAQGLKAIPDSRSLRINLANVLTEQGKLDEAEAQFRAFIKDEPKSVANNLMLVKYFQQTNQEAKALAQLETLTKEEPDQEDYWLGLAQIQFNREEGDKARKTLQAGIEKNKEGYGLRMALTNLLRQDKNKDAVIKLLKETVELDPQNAKAVPARQALAELYFEQGKAQEALDELKLVFERNPNDLGGHFLKGRILLSQNKAQEAIQEFRLVVKDQPELHAASGFLAQAHFMNNEPGLAIDVLQSTLKKDPNFVQGRQALAQYYQRHGEWDKALKELNLILEQNPARQDIKIWIGDINLSRGQFAKAKQAYDEAMTHKALEPVAWLKLAQLSLVQKDAKEALTRFDKALELTPASSEAMEGKALTLLLLNRGADALSFVQGLQAGQPANAFAHDLAARIALSQKRDDLAEGAFLKAIETNPNWLMPYFRLATMYVNTGKLSQGIERFKKESAAKPEMMHTAFLLGVLYQRKGDMKEAENRYAAIVAMRPDFLPAANNLAYLYAETSSDPKVLEKALELAKKSVVTEDPASLDTLGWIYYRLGNKEMAAEALSKALEKNPESPTVGFHLAKVLSESGNTKRAKEILDKVLKSKGEFKERAEAEKLFSAL